MHRLIRINNLQSNFPRLRLTSNDNVPHNEFENACNMCNKTHFCIKSFWRPRTTRVNTSQSITKLGKKRKKGGKSDAEVLIVTERNTCLKRAPVTRLTSADVKLLATTGLKLSELHKLKEHAKQVRFPNEHTYNNLAVIENMPSVGEDSFEVKDIFTSGESDNSSVINLNIPSNPLAENVHASLISELPLGQETALEQSDLGVLEPEQEIYTKIPVNRHEAFAPEVLDEHADPVEVEKEKEKEKDKPKIFVDPKAREEVEHKNLATYMEICCDLGTPQRGLDAIHCHIARTNYLKKISKDKNRHFVTVNKIGIYNIVLKGFADKGNFPKMLEVLNIAKSELVDTDVHSYAAILECLGRVNIENNHLDDITNHIKEMMSRGITFDQIMNECCFFNNERRFVLEAIRSFDPAYHPKYQTPSLQYQNHLVDGLNSPEQLKAPKKLPFKQNSGLFTPKSLSNATQKQLELEKTCYVTIDSVEATVKPTEEVLRHRHELANHYKTWEEAAYKGFNRYLRSLQYVEKTNKVHYEPYIRSIPVKEFVSIVVDEAKKLAEGSESYSPSLKQLYRDLGKKVYARYMVLKKQKTGVIDKIVNIHNKYCEDYARCHPELGAEPSSQGEILNPRQKWQWAEHSLKDSGSTLAMNHQEWVPPVLEYIGKFLYHILINDIKVDINCLKPNSKDKCLHPAFYPIFRTQDRKVHQEIKPNPFLCRLYRGAQPTKLSFPSYELPMLCPPLPWMGTEQGGYLTTPGELVRLPPHARAQRQRLHDTPAEQLFPSFDSLNQLAAVPWKVNERILDVILEVFNSGGSDNLNVPRPSSSFPPLSAPSKDMSPSEKAQFYKQKMQYQREKAEMYSLWCDCLHKLSIANHLRNDIFWLPHNMDFRGRVYPIPPHLNHLGSDLARSMLVFAESRPLGPHGLDWLKIHLVNLTGLKKRDPVEERLKFANEIMPDILDSADAPLTGRGWWRESEEPWQTLACCMEVAAAARSPNPELHRSHFPVHQDGSCNGLQHYAALGRDRDGARSVNMTPSPQPQDVYSAVVELVEKQRRRDAKDGDKIAKVLEGFVKRKVIKQTVMTTVYGVTRYGARLQIAGQLKALNDFPKADVWKAASYLTTKTFDSLGTMFTSSRNIQMWFTECAKLICKVGGRHVEWVTPLGLPIVQPYCQLSKIKYSRMYETFCMDKFEKPNAIKQKNAFAPNFVHSLDSSHMMLTSLFSERAGITFVSVHDCYWTHPSTIHIMNKICREQFVTLHSEPILDNLSVSFSEKYNCEKENDLTCDVKSSTKKKRKKKEEQDEEKMMKTFQDLPKIAEFDIKEVLDSTYFFS